MPVPGAEALRQKANTALGANSCIYDAAGNPLGTVGDALRVYLTNGSGGPTSDYQISDRDNSGAIAYYGYLDISGNWYISADDGSAVRYAKGAAGGYLAAWTGRVGLTYDYFDVVF